MSVLLDKLKEKNAAVGRAVGEALTLMHKYCFGLLDVVEDFISRFHGFLLYCQSHHAACFRCVFDL